MAGETPLRTFVTFDASFPDDGFFDSAGNCLKPAGKSIAETLVTDLRSQNLLVTEALQHSFYGWQFTVEISQHRFWVLLQCPGPWLLLSQARPSFVQRITFRNGEPFHRTLMQKVNSFLERDKRFDVKQWYTRDEYEKRVIKKKTKKA